MPYKQALAVVIPVYNEEQNLPALLADWQQVFRQTGVPYRVILIDDGSRDNSLQLLQKMAVNDPTLDIHTQQNAGHGPAIVKGYRLALDAEWVFQIDSDHQLQTGAFEQLWNRRTDFDLLLAERGDKNASRGRQWVSKISTIIVGTLFGRGVADVNCPYRLMRTAAIGAALGKMPESPFAPNVLLTSWFIRKKYRIFITRSEPRTTGLRRSRLNGYFLRGAIRSSLQTVLFRLR